MELKINTQDDFKNIETNLIDGSLEILVSKDIDGQFQEWIQKECKNRWSVTRQVRFGDEMKLEYFSYLIKTDNTGGGYSIWKTINHNKW